MSRAKHSYLNEFRIPQKIALTDKLVQSLMKIAECKPFLDEVLTTPLSVQLRRHAQIKAITYSNQIEGNKLDEKAVTADLIQKNQHGRLRTIPVSIVNEATGAEIEKCSDPTKVPFLMEELWEWLKKNDNANPFAKAFAFHYLAVAIHPFADKEVIEEAQALFEKSKKLSPDARSKKILKFAATKSQFQIKDIVDRLPDTPRRTLERDLELLVDQKKLKWRGEKKGRKYSVVE